MKENYISTRGFFDEKIDFLDTVRLGLSPDYGLFLPKDFEKINYSFLEKLVDLSYKDRAFEVLSLFPLGSLDKKYLKKILEDSYNEENFDNEKIAPIRHLKKNQYLLELFHGKTGSFKDIALSLTPKIFSKAIEKENQKYLIFTATSGDTGIASIEGYKNEKNTSIIVLYPDSGVSEIQKMQMKKVLGKNIFVIGVDGDFDFCQSSVKKIFNDKKLNKEILEKFNTSLSSANSINWGRLLPQVVYYFSSYADLLQKGVIKTGDEIDVCIPSGNFGNLLSAYYAYLCGLPIRKFISASNENKVLDDFFKTGIYDIRKRDLIKTASPSIDILKSSNIERLLYIISGENSIFTKSCMENLEKNGFFELDEKTKNTMKEFFYSGNCDNKTSLEYIKKTLDETGILLDPHTAVGVKVGDEFNDFEVPMIIGQTAHFAKFPFDVLDAIGGNSFGKNIGEIYKEIALFAPNSKNHKEIESLLSKEDTQNNFCEKDLEKIIQKIFGFLSKNL